MCVEIWCEYWRYLRKLVFLKEGGPQVGLGRPNEFHCVTGTGGVESPALDVGRVSPWLNLKGSLSCMKKNQGKLPAKTATLTYPLCPHNLMWK
jgi:hypothetical protein